MTDWLWLIFFAGVAVGAGIVVGIWRIIYLMNHDDWRY